MTSEETRKLKQRMADAVSLRSVSMMRDVLKDGYVADWPLGWGTEVRSPILTMNGHVMSPVTNTTLLTAVIAMDPFRNNRKAALKLLADSGASINNVDPIFAGRPLLDVLGSAARGPVLVAVAKCFGSIPITVAESSKYDIAPLIFNRRTNPLTEPRALYDQIERYLGTDCGRQLSAVLSARHIWGVLHPIIGPDDGFLLRDLMSYPGLTLSDTSMMFILDACLRAGCIRCSEVMQDVGADISARFDLPTYDGDKLSLPDGTSVELTLRQQFLFRLVMKALNIKMSGLETLAMADYCGTDWNLVGELETKLDGVHVCTPGSIHEAACVMNVNPSEIKTMEDLVATGRILACRECGGSVAIVYTKKENDSN